MKTKPKMTSKGVYLPDSVWEDLRAEAERTGRTQAWLLEQGVATILRWSKSEAPLNTLANLGAPTNV